jgi:Protein of unknown function (DUF1553)/Protein of unknown function (DUF1549)
LHDDAVRRLFLVSGAALVGWLGLGLGCAAPAPLPAPASNAPAALDAAKADGPHWAFVPPVRTPTLGGNPIDALVRARLRDAGLELAPPADRTTLLRRVTLDLIGLPPTPAEVDAFLADRDGGEDAAYQRVVDRLLASPHYGEAMALPWLDAARYADSNGFQQDGDTWQWVWRDWLVQKLNDDLPFDQLSTRMLAGDLLPDATDDDRLGTAFLRNHLLNGEGGAIPEENRFVMLFDRVDTTCTTWLGLTVACAQCHDHKYDPITQREYYALLDAFGRVPENGLAGGGPTRFRIAEPALDLPSPEQRQQRAAMVARLQQLETAGDQAALDAYRAEYDRFRRDAWPRVMVMQDAVERPTHLLRRGDYLQPGEVVGFGVPACLPPLPPAAPTNRLGLARWLFTGDHPLTARVAGNRAWQHFFGAGLVRTPEDFGTQGDRPVQQELLDTLAVDFVQSGWRSKALHRRIVSSAVYRQRSTASAELLARDPDNRLLARAPRFRRSSLMLRDQALAVSGLLVPTLGGPPVYPYQPDRVWEALAITNERDFTYPAAHGPDLWRRSLYTFWRRTVQPTNFFDTSPRQQCRVQVPVTNSPLHALVTLNDPTYVEAARALAARVAGEASDAGGRLAAAFRRVVARRPAADEVRLLAAMYERQLAAYAGDPAAAVALLAVGEAVTPCALPPVEHAALAAACLGILNLQEAQCRD